MKPTLLFLLAIASAAADSLELKDGTKLEGTILREEGDDYIVQVQVTKSIKDERRIPKADVVKQTAEKKDETAFVELAKLVPAPDLLGEPAYAARIAKVAAFLKAFPDSPKKSAALKIHDELETERAAITAGGVKFEGKMISAAERAPRAYGLDATIQANTVRAAVEANDMLSALRGWSKLETDFSGSSAYRELIPFMVTAMKSHLANVNTTLAGLDARVKAREAGLAGMSGNDRARSQQAIQDEQNAYLAHVAKEKADGIKWLSLDPYVKAPLDETKRLLDNEIRRLTNLDLTYLRNAEQAYADAWAEVTRPGATRREAEAAISKARGENVPQAYLDQLLAAAPAAEAP
jgi:hypothetical protein